jgi:hypothetical protein
MKRIVASFCILAAMLALPASGQQATLAEFKELSQLIAGRWLGDVTLVADWIGVGKKGERIVAHAEVLPVDDANVGLYRGFYGGAAETGIRAYDLAAKQIIEHGGGSGGWVWQATFVKKGGKWVQYLRGTDGDGVRFESERTWTFSDGGKVLTITGAQYVGGQKVGELRDIWRKVSR